ncbi:hypothetical protein ACI78V_14585 [Geodermatophilus sp. SYSU D00742]
MSGSRSAPGRLRRAPSGLAACLLAGCAAAGGSGVAAGPSPDAARDWHEATYSVTCDGIVPGGFRADLDGGAARVPADAGRSPYYEYYDVWFEAMASGDVDGDGEPDTVVLLQCSPQPSNGIVEEVHVFAADGRRLGLLPSPRTLRESTILAPLHDPTALSVRNGDIVAGMRAYAPEDNRADGPSIPITVRWHWTGREFVRVP